MKNIIKILKKDFEKIIKNPIAIVILAGLCIIPGIYAWLNIDSNWNPYDNTGSLPVAVVTEDEGYLILGTDVNIGESLVEALKNNKSMKWQFVDKKTALKKVDSGEYYGAIVIPKNFSNKIATLFDDNKIEKPQFDFYINQKKNPIAPIIVNKAIGTVQTSLNDAFVNALVYKIVNAAEYSNIFTNSNATTQDVIDKLNELKTQVSNMRDVVSLLGTTSDIASKSLENTKNILPEISDASNDTTNVISKANDIITSFDTQYGNTLSDISIIITSSKSIIDSMINNADEDLQSRKTKLNNLKQSITNLNTILDNYSKYIDVSKLVGFNNELIKLIEKATTAINNSDYATYLEQLKLIQLKLDEINAQYNNNVRPEMESFFSSVSKQMSSTVKLMNTLNNSLGNASSSIDNYISILNSTKTMTQNMDGILLAIDKDIDAVIEKLGGAVTSELYLKIVNLLKNDPNDIADFITNPIETKEHDYYAIDSYGSKMSPFYSVLACWVGCTLLVSVVKTKVKAGRNIKDLKPWQEYIGRYALFGGLSALQGLIIGIGDIVLGVQVKCVPLFLITLILTSLVFMLLVYSLTVAFGKIGEATAVVIMVLQVAGSGGTFPIELVPRFFQVLQPFMPFYPAMNMLRETIGGFYGVNYLLYLLVLLCHTIIPLLIGLVFRKPIIKFKEELSEKLEETDLVV